MKFKLLFLLSFLCTNLFAIESRYDSTAARTFQMTSSAAALTTFQGVVLSSFGVIESQYVNRNSTGSFVTINGNIGIGTINPDNKLSVIGNIGISGVTYASNTVYAYQIVVTSSTRALLYHHDYTSATVFGAQNVYERICGTSTINASGTVGYTNWFTNPTNTQLKYVGVTSKWFNIDIKGYYYTPAGTGTYEFMVAKNGTQIGWSEDEGVTTVQDRLDHFGLIAGAQLATNDVIEVYVKCTDGTTSITTKGVTVRITPAH